MLKSLLYAELTGNLVSECIKSTLNRVTINNHNSLKNLLVFEMTSN